MPSAALRASVGRRGTTRIARASARRKVITALSCAATGEGARPAVSGVRRFVTPVAATPSTAGTVLAATKDDGASVLAARTAPTLADTRGEVRFRAPPPRPGVFSGRRWGLAEEPFTARPATPVLVCTKVWNP